MLRYTTTFVFLLLSYVQIFAQYRLSPDKYWIQFTDKKNSPYSVSRANEFLSQRAIERRQRYKIGINETDLPLNPDYVKQVQTLGLKVVHQLKWFNAVIVQTNDTSMFGKVRALSFVKPYSKPQETKSAPPRNTDSVRKAFIGVNTMPQADKLYDYGEADNQITMLNGHLLHNLGYRGEGMIITVQDAGFLRVNELSAFDSIRANNQILGVWDFVQNDNEVYNEGSHGMQVLSTIAANLPGKMIGTAPKAQFYLFRTEDASTEYSIEEANWIAAAQVADSAGTDIITSSLGYYDFDDDTQDYPFKELNGNTAIVTRGADMAASKGILVVNSAGNEGNDPWRHITTPGDGDSVLTVGAVDGNGALAYFSSQGYSYDGRVKPNVTCKGLGSAVQSTWGDIDGANGTSFSCPIMAGMVACLWQAHPNLNNMQIIKAIEKSASQYSQPDSLLGYGIPDFYFAYQYPDGVPTYPITNEDFLNIYPNPFRNAFTMEITSEDFKARQMNAQVIITDMQGKKWLDKKIALDYMSTQISLPELPKLQAGTYFVNIITDKNNYKAKLMKQ